MYLKIKKIKKTPTTHWKNDLAITMVWLYDSSGKRTKRVKLNDVVMSTLENAKIEITEDLLNN